MADEIQPQHQALPPIANALQNMHCFLARALASNARTIATGPLAQQAAHMQAVIGNVAEVERLYEAAEMELRRLKPHEDFLALCREVHAEMFQIGDEKDQPAAEFCDQIEAFLSGAIADFQCGDFGEARTRFIRGAARIFYLLRLLDGQPMEAGDA